MIKLNKKSLKKNGIVDNLPVNTTKPIKVLFADEMRYGLMSNLRRSWSKVGERTVVQNQQEYSNRYLYSAIDPINGDSFHLLGFDDTTTQQSDIFLDQLKQRFIDNHILVIWDNAPFHKPKLLQRYHMSIVFLPSYSPQLNPVERLFGEIRKVTANRIFIDGIESQEKLIEQEIIKWMNNKTKTKQLCAYEWIKEQYDIIQYYYNLSTGG